MEVSRYWYKNWLKNFIKRYHTWTKINVEKDTRLIDSRKGKAFVQEKLKQNEEHLKQKREVIVIFCLQYKPLGNVFIMHLDLLKQSLKTCAFHILVLENLVLLKQVIGKVWLVYIEICRGNSSWSYLDLYSRSSPNFELTLLFDPYMNLSFIWLNSSGEATCMRPLDK